jgi:hypothetical protein
LLVERLLEFDSFAFIQRNFNDDDTVRALNIQVLALKDPLFALCSLMV